MIWLNWKENWIFAICIVSLTYKIDTVTESISKEHPFYHFTKSSPSQYAYYEGLTFWLCGLRKLHIQYNKNQRKSNLNLLFSSGSTTRNAFICRFANVHRASIKLGKINCSWYDVIRWIILQWMEHGTWIWVWWWMMVDGECQVVSSVIEG